jgi:hypothetical protein
MTSEEINELMNGKFESEYCKFENIPEEDRLAENRDICALLFLYNHLKNKRDFNLSPAHDILYLLDVDNLAELTEEDVLYLTRCGVHYDSSYDCLAIFT